MMGRLGLCAVTCLVCVGCAAASAQDAQDAGAPRARGPLRVRIEEPTAGIVDVGEGLTVDLHATVSDPRVRTALLAVGGASYEVPVEGGRIEQQVVVTPGNNRVGVVVRRGSATARDTVTFFARGARADLVVMLTWAARGEIIDLWVREPSGETCKWDHRETGTGGRLLDFSADAIGFGSQAYVLPAVVSGTYRIKIHYWSARAMDDSRGHWAYAEMIARLDELASQLAGAAIEPARHEQLLAERRRLEQRLDRWAEPGAPQTPVHAEAILFPGTPHERRWRFDLVAQRTGQLVALGEIEVTDAMIRAARQTGGVR